MSQRKENGIMLTDVYAQREIDSAVAAMFGLDERDTEIVRQRLADRQRFNEALVGDYVRSERGIWRIGHIWESQCIQPARGGSFYLQDGGTLSYSGAFLYPNEPVGALATDEMRDGSAWIFHHGFRRAHNGINVVIPCRIWQASKRTIQEGANQ